MTRPVLLAGVLGGVLGGVFTFGLLRTFPAAPRSLTPQSQSSQPSEGRQFADDLIAKVQAGKNDEFLVGVRAAFPSMNDEEFNQTVRQQLLTSRDGFAKWYGQPSAFEFLHESRVGTNIVRFVYLEKFPRGGVVWVIACYNGSDGWRVLAFHQLKPETAFDLVH